MQVNPYNDLKKVLGKCDARNEYIELILREFEEEKDKKNLKELSEKHEIKLDTFDFDELKKKNINNYILTVHLCFEEYLNKINNLGKEIGKNWKNKKNEGSLLEHIKENVDFNEKMIDLFEICEYYRMVRNVYLHNGKSKEISLEKYREIRKKNFPEIKEEVPNDILNLSFYDFIFFTVAVKKLGKLIYFNLKYDLEKIKKNLDVTYKKFNKLKNNEKRLESSIEMELKTCYNISNEERKECVEYIKNKVKNG
ncbi:MAG: hypothetical protein ACK5NU_02355 [Fusobacterium ulcerans]|uniref:hypothetical protein n=1 Tax=Fusobacterium ulcerans TaxID=861 RepID=UPI003A840D7C